MLSADDIEPSALNVLIYIKEGRNNILKKKESKFIRQDCRYKVRVARRRRPRRSSEVSLPGSVIFDY